MMHYIPWSLVDPVDLLSRWLGHVNARTLLPLWMGNVNAGALLSPIILHWDTIIRMVAMASVEKHY